MKKWMIRVLVALIVIGLLLWNVTLSRELSESRRMLGEVRDTEAKLERLAQNDLDLQGEILDIWEIFVKRTTSK